MKNYLQFITEKKMEKDEVYKKYFSSLEKEVFDKIYDTSNKYYRWLIKLYNDKKLKLEDLYKAEKYLKTFDEFKHKFKGIDIFKLESLPELFLLVKDYIQEEVINEDERKYIGQFKEVFENNTYRIIIPLTLEASKYFGRNTEWCTLNTDMFKKYTKKQNPNEITKNNLYIFYTEDLDKRLQFHFKSRQFMNKNDDEIDIETFFDENKDIFNFFNKYFNPIIKDIRWSKNTLEGAPKIVEGNFNCYNNQLTSLKGAPEKVEGNFNCSNNQLTSLKGAPEKVEGDFYCYNNKLTSLEGAPKKVEGNFKCLSNNLKESDIEWLKQNCEIKGEIIWK